jgi:hypothetical protein
MTSHVGPMEALPRSLVEDRGDDIASVTARVLDGLKSLTPKDAEEIVMEAAILMSKVKDYR